MNTLNIVRQGVEEGGVILIAFGLMFALFYIARGLARDAAGPLYVHIFMILFAFFIIFTIGWEWESVITRKIFWTSKFLTVGAGLIGAGILSGWSECRARQRGRQGGLK